MGSIDSLVQKMLSKCSLGQGSVSQSLQLWSSEVRETRTIPCQSVVESIYQLKGGGGLLLRLHTGSGGSV